jgi:hypothetical protein
MGQLKEKYLNNMEVNQNDFSDAEYTYLDWKMEEVNDSIKLKYSKRDVRWALDAVLSDDAKLKGDIMKKLDILYSEKNGFYD